MDHVCTCRSCSPDTFPPEAHAFGPTQAAHFAARWCFDHQTLEPYMDGLPLPMSTEVMARPDGWAILHNMHRCACDSGEPCESVRYGSVTITDRIPL